jgi:hypothetical protein
MHQQIERTGHRQFIGGPTMQHVEIGYALLDETNNLGVHDALPLMRAASSTMRG